MADALDIDPVTEQLRGLRDGFVDLRSKAKKHDLAKLSLAIKRIDAMIAKHEQRRATNA